MTKQQKLNYNRVLRLMECISTDINQLGFLDMEMPLDVTTRTLYMRLHVYYKQLDYLAHFLHKEFTDERKS